MGNMPWIIFSVKNDTFAISSKNVLSIIKSPSVTIVPNAREYIRGIIKYRDKIYNLWDLRKILAIESNEQEINNFNNMLCKREEEHINWINELKNSVDEKRPFELNTNPHKCAFGKWYDNYKCNNLKLRSILYKFDRPHKRIHAIAEEVEKLKIEKKYSEAKKVIEDTSNTTLKEMIKLFENIKQEFHRTFAETVLLLEKNSKRQAIPVNAVLAVEDLEEINDEGQTDSYSKYFDKTFIQSLGKRKNNDIIVKLADEYFFNS